MNRLKSDKIVLKNLQKGEGLYNVGFSLSKLGASHNYYELVEIGMRMMEKGLRNENT